MVLKGSSGSCWSCWVGFSIGMSKKICHTEPKSSSAPAISPTNILLIHSIMSWYVQMMIIDASEMIIWSMSIMLIWISHWHFKKNHHICPTSEPKSSSAPAISPTNILLIHSIILRIHGSELLRNILQPFYSVLWNSGTSFLFLDSPDFAHNSIFKWK